MAIREYRESDIERVMEIYNRTTLKCNWQDLNDEQKKIMLLKDEAKASALMNSNITLILEEDDMARGFIMMTSGGYIRFLYVDNKQFGKGYGRALMAAMEKKARESGLKKIYLHASVYTASRKIYEKLGFDNLGPEKYEIVGVEFEGYMMEKKLKEERFRGHVAAYLVLEKDSRILLSKRKNTGYQDGMYSLVSRHLEGGETVCQCMIREAKEEAGITLAPNGLKVVHVMHRNNTDFGREYIDIALSAREWQGEIVNMEPDKCDGLEWFPLDGLPENIVPEVRMVLENIRDGVFYGEFGW
jgi:8-oxo-dGTP pyrophosphatase MutT (NUDIX family)/N-acetylglutamate synthase-like GNAT family acetyltransferase